MEDDPEDEEGDGRVDSDSTLKSMKSMSDIRRSLSKLSMRICGDIRFGFRLSIVRLCRVIVGT